MFAKAKTFVKNHWKKVVYGGVAIQAASYGLKYATNKLLQYHEEQAKDMWLKMKKREHFDRLYLNVQTTVLSLLPTLRDTISNTLNSEALTAKLKEGVGNKLEIWEEMKIIAISRVLASIYGTTLLNILVRIQLGIIGGYMIQDSNLENTFTPGSGLPPPNGPSGSQQPRISAELQHEYLSLANHFVTDGMARLCTYIYRQTKTVIGPISLKRRIEIQDLEQLLWHIIDLIRNENNEDVRNSAASPLRNSWRYIFPNEIVKRYDYFEIAEDPAAIPELSEDIAKEIMCETYDLLQSQDVAVLLTNFETHGVSHMLDRLADIITENQTTMSVSTSIVPSNGNSSEPTNKGTVEGHHHINSVHDLSIPFAKLIPLLNSYAPNNLNEEDPWISVTSQADNLRTFGANVYESFSLPIPIPL